MDKPLSYNGTLKLRSNGNNRILSVPNVFDKHLSHHYKVQMNSKGQIIYTPTVTHVNMFSKPIWKHFNYRKALKRDGIPLDSNPVGKEK